MSDDWGNPIAHQLKQRTLASGRNHRVWKLNQRIRSSRDCRRSVPLAELLDDLVREPKLAPQYDFGIPAQLTVQFLDSLVEKLGIVGRMVAVVGVRRSNQHANAVVGGGPAHLDRFIQAVRAIVYLGKYVAVNINHECSSRA